MKILIIFFILIANSFGFAQGLEFLSEDEYKNIPAPQTLTGASAGMDIPEKYVIPESAFPAAGSQGSQPSCTAWATGYAFMSFYHGAKQGWSLAEQQNVFSPGFLYQNIKGEGNCANCKCGTYISVALDYLKNTGIVPLSKFPYNDKQCTKPSSELNSTANKYKIKNWYRVKDVYNFTDLKTYLSRDMPIIIASYTDNAFSQYYNKKESDTFYWRSGQDKGGNHAMLLVGYDNSRKAFKVMNSWGKTWGTNGFVWIDYESFRTMIVEAYVVEKDYELNSNGNNTNYTDNNPVIVDNKVIIETTSDINSDFFELYGYKEEIGKNRYSFTFGFMMDESVENLVKKVVYVYDDPSFSNKYYTALTGPNYITSYEGWGCINSMYAVIYFKDGTQLAYEFDACMLIEEFEDYEWESEIEIVPVVSVSETNTENVYNFVIELHGIDAIKDQVSKVVYDLNHSSFKNRYITTTNSSNNFSGGYYGWGCLQNVIVYIYYTDGTYDSFEVNLCEELGW